MYGFRQTKSRARAPRRPPLVESGPGARFDDPEIAESPVSPPNNKGTLIREKAKYDPAKNKMAQIRPRKLLAGDISRRDLHVLLRNSAIWFITISIVRGLKTGLLLLL